MSAESIWKNLKGQIYLGDDDFVEQMRSKLGERDEDVNIPRVQQRGPAPKLSAIRRQHKIGTTRFGQRTRPGPTAINRSRRNLEFTSRQWGELCASQSSE